MTDDNLDDVQQSVGKRPSLLEQEIFNEKEIWNAAIEAAEIALHKKLSFPTEACAVVRSLKK